MNKPTIIQFQQIGNEEIGYISVAERNNLPFIPKRVYWTYKVPEHVMRGGHAHKTLQQILVALSGTLEIKVWHNGKVYEFILDNPNMGLYLPPISWREIIFRNNAILLCIASDVYRAEDYIRDFDLFMEKFFPSND